METAVDPVQIIPTIYVSSQMCLLVLYFNNSRENARQVVYDVEDFCKKEKKYYCCNFYFILLKNTAFF